MLKAGLKTEIGFCTVCDFAHARPIMLSILLVIIIGATVSEPPLVDSTDALSRYIYIDIDIYYQELMSRPKGGRSVQLRGTAFESERSRHFPYMDLFSSGA